jgi:hypothetical protein
VIWLGDRWPRPSPHRTAAGWRRSVARRFRHLRAQIATAIKLASSRLRSVSSCSPATLISVIQLPTDAAPPVRSLVLSRREASLLSLLAIRQSVTPFGSSEHAYLQHFISSVPEGGAIGTGLIWTMLVCVRMPSRVSCR